MAEIAQPVNLAKFGQNPRTARATVVSAAGTVNAPTVANLQKLFTVPAGGCILSKLTAMPKATISAALGLLLYASTDGVTFTLIDSVTMPAQIISTSGGIAKTYFGDYAENTPDRLEAGLQLWVGITVAQASGIDFKGSFTRFPGDLMPSTYPYNLRGAPSIGGGLPGLPRGAPNTIGADPTGFPAKFLFVRADAFVLMPDWATFYRATAVGNGGQGGVDATSAGGGGGGACSGTATTPERAIPGSPIQIRFAATAVVVAVLGYLLSAGHGGSGGPFGGGAGGIATGGAVNFNGGNGGGTSGSSSGGGGGAATRYGPGGNGAVGIVGQGGTAGGYFSVGAPGGFARPSTAGSPGVAPTGVVLSFAATVTLAGFQTFRNGADGGGGGGSDSSDPTACKGGPGFVLLEFW